MVGTGASGVQLIPAIVAEVASLTVYQRTANWCTPLNNSPITPDEQAQLKAGFETMRDTLNTSQSGFLHGPHDRATFDDSREERWAFYETIWNSLGFAKMISNYTDMLMNKDANAEWCEFIAEKIRSIVKDPETADKLIPKDHGYAGKRPPFVTGYYEAFNLPHVSLVDLYETPMERVTETGIETADGLREFDVIAWATGFDFGTGALNRMGIRGRGGLPLEEYWADGPSTFLGLMTHGFPNLFFPGGPHGATGNNPRYSGDQADFIHDALVYTREHGYRTIEVPLPPKKSGRPWSTPTGPRPPLPRPATSSAPTFPASRSSTSSIPVDDPSSSRRWRRWSGTTTRGSCRKPEPTGGRARSTRRFIRRRVPTPAVASP